MMEKARDHPNEEAFIAGIKKHVRQFFTFAEGSMVLETEIDDLLKCVNSDFCHGSFYQHYEECEKASNYIRIKIVNECKTSWKEESIKEKIRLAKIHLKDEGILQFNERHNDMFLREVITFFC